MVQISTAEVTLVLTKLGNRAVLVQPLVKESADDDYFVINRIAKPRMHCLTDMTGSSDFQLSPLDTCDGNGFAIAYQEPTKWQSPLQHAICSGAGHISAYVLELAFIDLHPKLPRTGTKAKLVERMLEMFAPVWGLSDGEVEAIKEKAKHSQRGSGSRRTGNSRVRSSVAKSDADGLVAECCEAEPHAYSEDGGDEEIDDVVGDASLAAKEVEAKPPKSTKDDEPPKSTNDDDDDDDDDEVFPPGVDEDEICDKKKCASGSAGSAPVWSVAVPVPHDAYRPESGKRLGPDGKYILIVHPSKENLFYVFEGIQKKGTLSLIPARVRAGSAADNTYAHKRWSARCCHGADLMGEDVKCTRSFSTEYWPNAFHSACSWLLNGIGLTRDDHQTLPRV